MKMKRPLYVAVCLLAVLVLVLVGVIGGLQGWESTNSTSAQTEVPAADRKTITRDGVDYYPRQDITTVMLLGIDAPGTVKSSGSYRNNGEADAVMLMILDHKDESYTLLCLNRDTMLDMETLGVRGEKAGTMRGQLALAHTYGSGLEDSCENVKNTLVNFLPGLTVDYYVSVNMDAIPVINDMVGGVEVTITDDFSAVSSSLKKGTMTLQGDQALTFVRSRMDVGNQLNISRMNRHEEYMKGLMSATAEKFEESDTFALELYEQAEPYMVTDCSVNIFTKLLQRCWDYTMKEILSLEGKNVLGEEYYEFYVDKQKLDELTLRLFYAPK